MAYDYLPKVSNRLLENGLKTLVRSTQPEILILGESTSGRTYEKVRVGSVGQAESEYGGATPLLRGVHEAVAQGADNISVMRIGGKQAKVVLEDADGGTLTVTPWYRDNLILDRYVLVLDNARYLVYDKEDGVWVFDSDEILVINNGIVEVVSDGWADNVTLNDITLPDTGVTLGDLATTDTTPDLGDLTVTQGTDGTNPSLAERYAALTTAYHLLDFKDADIVVPMDVFIDDAKASGTETYGLYWGGLPVADSAQDKLGWGWHYLYEGVMYTAMVDTSTYFSVARAAAHLTANGITLTALVYGKGGNACTFQIADAGTGNPTAVTVTENTNRGLDILVEFDFGGTVTRSSVDTAIETALADFTHSGGLTGNQLIAVTNSGSNMTGSVTAKTNLSGGTGGHVLTHTDLTGEEMPSVVLNAFIADDTDGANTTLREVDFTHQLGTFCHLASTQWKNLMGAMSVKKPDGVGLRQIASWIGELPNYSDNGSELYIESGDNGTGLLGFKYLAGAYDYRTSMVSTAAASEGYGYGGYILTYGTGLHTTDFPYGINDGDEAVDSHGKPIDLGKYLWLFYEWAVLQNGYAGGTAYRGNLAAYAAGRLATLPANKLPIGQYGTLKRVAAPLKVHSTQKNALARIRLSGLKQDELFGLTITSGQTAAHPSSDYTEVSTIRCVNEIMASIRRIMKPNIGNSHNPLVIASMQQAVDGYLASVKGPEGLHQGALATITYTRLDRLLGKVNIDLRMVPPFAIKEIAVTMSLAADESEI